MNSDTDFLRELLTDWKVPFDDHCQGRRIAVACLIKDKHDEIEALKARVKELEDKINGIYISVNEI